jgi:hypothetical protein
MMRSGAMERTGMKYADANVVNNTKMARVVAIFSHWFFQKLFSATQDATQVKTVEEITGYRRNLSIKIVVILASSELNIFTFV